MSFTTVEQAPARLNRSELAVPGSVTKFFEKAAGGDADVIFLDLEDAVAPGEKEAARKNVIAALNDIDWQGKTMSVRVNGLDTHWMYRDVIDVVEQAGWQSLLELAAVISMSLGVLNILPLPMLDGGRVAFVLLEYLRGGKRVRPEREAIVHFTGLIAMLGLAVVITYFDILRIFEG